MKKLAVILIVLFATVKIVEQAEPIYEKKVAKKIEDEAFSLWRSGNRMLTIGESRSGNALLDSALFILPSTRMYRHRNYSDLRTGAYGKVSVSLQKMKALDRDFLGYSGLTKLYNFRDYQSALADLVAYNQLDDEIKYPNAENVWMAIGQARHLLQDYLGAIHSFTECIFEESRITIESVNIYAFVYRGISKFKAGDLNGAIDDFNKTIELYPECPEALYFLAKCYQELGYPRNEIIELTEEALCYAEKGYIRAYSVYQMPIQLYLSDIKSFLSAMNG